MGSLGEAAKTSVRGSFNLLIGNIVSMLSSVSGSILVARMLSPSEYGLFSVSLILPALLLLFADWGVDTALVRFIARFRSEDTPEKIWDLLKASFLFKVAVGGALSLFLFLFADNLAAVLLQRPDVGGLVRIAALSILFESLYFSFLSVLSGLERMGQQAIVNMFQSVVHGVVSPLLVFFGLGVSGAIIGSVLSYLVAACVGFLFILSSSKRESSDIVSPRLVSNLRVLIGFGFPLFIGALVAGFTNNLRNFLLSWFVSDETIGNYAVAFRFFTLISLVSVSIRTTLYPAFSKFNYSIEPDTTREVFQGSVRYASIVVLPLTLLSMAVSRLVVEMFFIDKYSNAPLFTNLLLTSLLLTGSGSLSIRSFLNSQGNTTASTKVGLAGSVGFIILSPVSIWAWGVEGLILSITLSSLISNLLGLLVLHRIYAITPDFKHTGRVLVCSLVSAGISQGVLRLLPINIPLFGLFVTIAVFISVFFMLAPITGTIHKQDLTNLDFVIKGLGKLYPFVRPILLFESKVLRLWLRIRNQAEGITPESE
jgi:stage V sporulation protein B